MEHGGLGELVGEENPAASEKPAGPTLALTAPWPTVILLTVASLIFPVPNAVSLTVVYLLTVPRPIFGFCLAQSMLSWCPPGLGQRQFPLARLCVHVHVVQPMFPASPQHLGEEPSLA